MKKYGSIAFGAALAVVCALTMTICAGATGKIRVEKTDPVTFEASAGTAETELSKLLTAMALDASYRVEASQASTGENRLSEASILSRDTECVRIETRLSTGASAVTVIEDGRGWTYFPETNSIIDFEPGRASADAGTLLTARRLLAPASSGASVKALEGGQGKRYEASVPGGETTIYAFTLDGVLERVTLAGRGGDTLEIVIRDFRRGKIPAEKFQRPSGAVRIPTGMEGH